MRESTRLLILPAIVGIVAFVMFLSCTNVESLVRTDDEPTEPEEPDYGDPPAEIQWVPVESLFVNFPDKRRLSLIYVDAKWCHWCHVMEDSTLCDTGVIREIWQHFNPARLDLDDSTILRIGDTLISAHDLAKDVYGVDAVPTSIFLTREGQYLRDLTGYIRPSHYKVLLDQIVGWQ